MTGDLSHCTEDQLLNYVMLILARAEYPLSAFSLCELEQIETELCRRGSPVTAYDNLR